MSDMEGWTEVVELTKRERFAMAALQGLLSERWYSFEEAAYRAIKIADRVIEELSNDTQERL
tara:strand:- start:141 stop:326 length:186 start_codon:yes stop_codon:yes gene_type:complete